MHDKTFDYIILGAGPAGLQAAHFMKAVGMDYLVLEGGSGPGTFFRTFPRHRQLISINKRYTGQHDPEVSLRMDWNSLLSQSERLLFRHYSERFFPHADDMVRYLEDFAAAGEFRIQYDTRVEHVGRAGAFELRDQHGRRYTCRRLIVATGMSRPYVPDISGFDLVERYATESVDPKDFIDQRVLIIGKGNSAFETADNLMDTTAWVHVAGPSAIKLAWKTHYVGHLRAVNNNLLDTYQLKSQNAVLDGHVVSIDRRDDGFHVVFSFSRANEVHKELVYDRVIACTGFGFDSSIFDAGCRPALTIKDRFPEQTEHWESVNVPDLFFAGTLMQQRDFKRSTSGFVHGFRYCVRALVRHLGQRHHDTPWPAQALAATPQALMEKVIERVNRSSALWQQFQFLGDVLVVDGAQARYFEEVPVDLAKTSEWAKADLHFIVTLEYGPDHDKVDPFDITVRRVAQDDAERAFDSSYLHPVVRCYAGGALIAEHHVPENLENEWNRPAHQASLRKFFAERLAAAFAKTIDHERADDIEAA